MKMFIVFGLVLAAALMAYMGFRVIRNENTLDGRVMTSFAMVFFVGLILGLAYKVYVSPLP